MSRTERSDFSPPPPQYGEYEQKTNEVEKKPEKEGEEAPKVRPGQAFGRIFTILKPERMLRFVIEKMNSLQENTMAYLASILKKFPGRAPTAEPGTMMPGPSNTVSKPVHTAQPETHVDAPTLAIAPPDEQGAMVPSPANAVSEPVHTVPPETHVDAPTVAMQWLAQKVTAPAQGVSARDILKVLKAAVDAKLMALAASEGTLHEAPAVSHPDTPAARPDILPQEPPKIPEALPLLSPETQAVMDQAIKARDTPLAKLNEISAQLEKSQLTTEQMKMFEECKERIRQETYKNSLSTTRDFNKLYLAARNSAWRSDEFGREVTEIVQKRRRELCVETLNDPNATLEELKRVQAHLIPGKIRWVPIPDPSKTLTTLCNARIEYAELREKIEAAKTEQELSSLEEAVTESESSLIMEQKFGAKDLILLFTEKQKDLRRANGRI
jgi:hypothetical protein